MGNTLLFLFITMIGSLIRNSENYFIELNEFYLNAPCNPMHYAPCALSLETSKKSWSVIVNNLLISQEGSF